MPVPPVVLLLARSPQDRAFLSALPVKLGPADKVIAMAYQIASTSSTVCAAATAALR